MKRLRNAAVLLFAAVALVAGLGTVVPMILGRPRLIHDLDQLAFVLILLVCLLLGPPLLKDDAPHPGLVLCFFAATVSLALLIAAAWDLSPGRE